MERDILVLIRFIHTYCRHNHIEKVKSPFSNPHTHLDGQITLCNGCASLAHYSIDKRVKCPQKNKPSCKNCTIKCYSQEYRSKIKEVMKFSGIYFIKRGRIDYLIKYFF